MTIENIDLSKLKPYKTSRTTSFEMMWYLLAESQYGDMGKFTPIDDSGGGDGVEFYLTLSNDRALFNMLMISDFVDNHFAYSKGSPLNMRNFYFWRRKLGLISKNFVTLPTPKRPQAIACVPR